MAAGNWKVYGAALEAIFKGDLDVDTSFRMVLVTSSYTPNQSTHATWTDVSSNEVANGNGYATHGKAAGVVVSRTGLEVTVDADNQTWEDSSITAKYALLVHDADSNGALASTDKLLAFADLNDGGGSLVSTNANFTVNIHADGVAVATAD